MATTESLIKAIGDNPLPPVEAWNPDYCGELGMLIKADGTWLYQGTPFTRKRMQQLFSRVMKKEGDNYYLVTPVEKVGIEIEWMPFVIIDFDTVEIQGQRVLRLSDNCGNQVDLTSYDQMTFSEYQEQQLPVVCIRRNLFASFTRSCYYRLLELAQSRRSGVEEQLVIESNQIEFVIGQYRP